MFSPSAPSNTSPIDAVITWVDGNDPVLTQKRNHYLRQEGRTEADTGALPTRFASNDEIRYCVLSILRFAPFIRNIFIVTDGQDPNLHDEIRTHFPERGRSYTLVDHKELFYGFEKYLPTFNSTSILSMLWRIENLSDNFVYFNDDVFLTNNIEPEDWVINNQPVLRGKWQLPPYKKILTDTLKIFFKKTFTANPLYQPRISFYIRQWRAASILGFRFRYFFHCHTPHVLNRTMLSKYFQSHPLQLESNISYRFRTHNQFITSSLAFHLEILSGNKNFARLNLVYLHPYYSSKRIMRRIKRCEEDPRIKSLCAQSIDLFSREIQDAIFGFMDKRLNLPSKTND